MKYIHLLLLCFTTLWTPTKTYSVEADVETNAKVDFVSEGLIYKTHNTTSTTKPTRPNIHDNIELQINQINEDKRLEKLHKKAQIKELKEKAKKAGFELIIEDDKIIKVLKTH